MNEKLLEQIGLTKGEIKVYLTLLKIGETTTGKIIENAEISSGKIYEILDKLINKGLASYLIKNKTKYFSASSPKRILDYIEEKEVKLQQDKLQIEKELPILLGLREKSESYETRLYKGFKGYQTAIYESLYDLKKNDEIFAMGIINTRKEKYNALWKQWHKERIKLKLSCKLIFSEKKADYYKYYTNLKYSEIRIIPGMTPATIDIIGNKSLISTNGENPSVLVIDNPEVTQSLKTFFLSLWAIAKKM
jgi:HTH-type transcriptional regulator, sugar sensing transcriptional regulator